MRSNDDKFYTLSIILMIVFMAIVIGVEFFGLSIFTLGFIFFGFPVIVMAAVFWYDLLDSFLNS